MAIYILVLINNIRKRKIAEKELFGANQELVALYEQISAADQQLKNQLDELVEANDKLQVSEEKYRLVAEAANDIIWEWELGSNKLHFSRRLQGILGYSEDEINMTEWSNIIAPEDVDYVRTKIESVIEKEQKDCTCEYRVRHKRGKLLWMITKAKVLYDQLGYPYKIVGSHTDITQLKEHQDRILQMAYHDALTNLPNRSYLKEYVEELISGEPDSKFAIVYIDIDDFKTINDNFGHSEGDRFLKEIGSRFSEMSGDGISIFRLGGDEYVIVLKDVKDSVDVSKYLDRIFREFGKPINLAEMKLHITLSAVAVIYPSDGTNFDDLLKNADIAMYQVKNKGKNNYIFFDESMQKGIMERMFLENSLREAVKNMDFTLNYQPILELSSEKICSLEALIRWNSPELGPVSPVVFIKLAEENGLIIPIGNWVLRTGCSYAAKLAAAGYHGITVSINISPVQLMQADFVQSVKAIADSCGVEPDRIKLEITESVLIDSFESSLRKLNELKEHGFHISLDDFGQGYSSLTYLRRLPINIIKIDKAFIDDIQENEGNDQIVYAITELSHRMGLTVYAEGVETEQQLRYLKSIKCDGIQGYFISKPLPGSEIAGLLNRIGCIGSKK
jgi:diguanylate cyclase (GGDEF)-like protein/PAS domain S-box-containing protein